jgi:murein DD-endopeptidase MepM/ murein hydrolase activator NlpD
VSQGEVIGYVRNTGNTDVSDLHFEVHPVAEQQSTRLHWFAPPAADPIDASAGRGGQASSM